MQFVQCLWLEVFVEQRCLSHLKNTLNMVAMETKVYHKIKLSEKLNSRLLVQEEHGFQKGAQCAPLVTGAQKKPGLDRVKPRIRKQSSARDRGVLQLLQHSSWPTSH